jgi:uncharacterized membrane protein YeaQ/YmgE (transglycosylase-associated protein family)
MDRGGHHRGLACRTDYRPEPGLLTNLVVGIIGAFLGGFIFSSLLGFRYEERFNVPSIVVATVGAVVLLAIFGGIRTRRTWP